MLYHNSALPTDSLLISPYDSLPFFFKFRDYFTLLFFKCQSFLFFLTITLFDNFLSIFSYLSFFICPKFSHFPPVFIYLLLNMLKICTNYLCFFRKILVVTHIPFGNMIQIWPLYTIEFDFFCQSL